MWFVLILASIHLPTLLASFDSTFLPLRLSISNEHANSFIGNHSELICPLHRGRFLSSPDHLNFKHINQFQTPVRLEQFQNGFFKSRCFPDTVDWDIEELCIFVNPTTNQGQGMVIIASIKSLSDSFANGLDVYGDIVDPQAVEVVEVPEKGGMGAVAAHKLQQGDPVVLERPVGIFPCSTELWDTDYGRNIRRQAIDHLPKHTRLAVSRLHGVGETEDEFFSDVIEKNAFSLSLSEDDAMEYGALVLVGARVNHDCRPNVAYFIDPDTKLFHMTALETIEPGSELTDSYRLLDVVREERRESLKESYGFDCKCSHCQMNEEEGKKSDERILRLQSLLEQDDSTLEEIQELLGLCEQENIPWCKVQANFAAAAFYNSQGKTEKVVQHALISKKLGLILAGSKWEQLEEVDLILNTPSMHRSHFSQL